MWVILTGDENKGITVLNEKGFGTCHSLFIKGDKVGADRCLQSKHLHNTALVHTGQQIVRAIERQCLDGVICGGWIEFARLLHCLVVMHLNVAMASAQCNIKAVVVGTGHGVRNVGPDPAHEHDFVWKVELTQLLTHASQRNLIPHSPLSFVVFFLRYSMG